VTGRTFTVEYDSGVDAAERSMSFERKEIVVSGWTGQSIATSNRDDYQTNRVTVANVNDANSYGDAAIQGLSAAGACVSFWAGNTAGLPLHVQRKVNGVDVPFPEHPLYWLLHDSPNYDQSAFDFWEYMVESLEWRGNAYALMARRDGDFLISLTPLSPDDVKPFRRPDGSIAYRCHVDGKPQVIDGRDMLHIRGRGGDALGGKSTLATYRQALGLAHATETSAETIFRNGVRSSGALKVPDKLNPDQREILEAGVARKFTGAANAGRPMILDNGMTWEKLTIDPVDAEMIASRQLNMVIVCQIFEVDPHLVGITSGNTQLGSSISDQTLSLVKFKMHKRLKRIEKALEKQLLSRFDRQRGVTIRFNLEGFLRADSLGRAQYYNLMKQFMTTNEIRALEGLPPVPGGDEIYRQVQDQPLGSRGIGDNGGPPLEKNP
jgi:HK97 family phage portal protein